MSKSPVVSALFKEVFADMARESAEKPAKMAMTPEEQKEILSRFLLHDVANLKVGDYVERNEFGMDEYLLPREGQIACVADIFPVPLLNKKGDVVNGQIMAVFKHDHDDKGAHTHLQLYPVDLRMYQKVK